MWSRRDSSPWPAPASRRQSSRGRRGSQLASYPQAGAKRRRPIASWRDVVLASSCCFSIYSAILPYRTQMLGNAFSMQETKGQNVEGRRTAAEGRRLVSELTAAVDRAGAGFYSDFVFCPSSAGVACCYLCPPPPG